MKRTARTRRATTQRWIVVLSEHGRSPDHMQNSSVCWSADQPSKIELSLITGRDDADPLQLPTTGGILSSSKARNGSRLGASGDRCKRSKIMMIGSSAARGSSKADCLRARACGSQVDGRRQTRGLASRSLEPLRHYGEGHRSSYGLHPGYGLQYRMDLPRLCHTQGRDRLRRDLG